jgi:hypothetical protein
MALALPAFGFVLLTQSCTPDTPQAQRARTRRAMRGAVRFPGSNPDVVQIDSSADSAARTRPALVRGDYGIVWRGVYQRDGDQVSFRVCATRRRRFVRAAPELQGRLDANVEFHADRPRTSVFAQIQGDSTAGQGGDTTAVRDTIAIAAVDSVRALEPDECNPSRPLRPPPYDRSKLEAAVRRVLGTDAAKLPSSGAFDAAAVWLNGDERGDALVLLRGASFCETPGCTLLALEGTPQGDYSLAKRIVSVKSPVYLLVRSTNGLHDLAVTVGRGIYGTRLVQLSSGRRGYPPNAALEPDARPSKGQLIFRN